MKLCHVVPSLAEQHGGPSRSVRALCAALARGGDEVDLFTTAPAGSGDAAVDGRLRTVTFRRAWPDRLCRSPQLNAALQRSGADVVHHHSLWLRTLHYAHRACSRGKKVFVVSPRGMMSRWAWRHHRGRKLLSQLVVHPGAIASVDGWHATSEEEQAEIRALGLRQPVCVAPNGVEAPSAAEQARAAAHWHGLCPETQQRPVALFYSRFHSKKRVIELIDLWLEHGPSDWLLLLVGIPQEYAPAQLERYVTKMGAAGRVRAFSGLGQPAPYAVASLFLLPSHNENFGLVIAEAMAHGLPVAVTDTTPWHELTRRELGWCVPWADFGGVLRAATAEGVAPLRQRGKAARDWVLAEFSWDKSARTLADFYRALRPAKHE